MIVLSLGGIFWRLQHGGIDIAPLLSRWEPLDVPIEQPVLNIHWGEVRLSLEDRLENKAEAAGSFWHIPYYLKVTLGALYTEDAHSHDRESSIKHLEFFINFIPLLKGDIEPVYADIEGASVKLRYFENGEWGLGYLPLSPFLHPKKQEDAKPFPIEKFLQNFKAITLENSHFSFDNARVKSAQNSHMDVMIHEINIAHSCYASCSLYQGWEGRLEGHMVMGEEDVPLSLVLKDDKNHQRWQVQLQKITPSRWEEWLENNTLKLLKFPLSLTSEGEIIGGDKFSFPHASLAIHLGEGVFAPYLGAQEIHLKDADIKAELIAGQTNLVKISIPSLHVVDRLGALSSLTLESTMTVDKILLPQHIDIALDTELPSFNFATLASIWPEGEMKGARRWMTQNMTEGAGKNLHIQMHLASTKGFSDLDVKELKGDLYGENLNVTWLKPIQPVTNLAAHAFFVTPDLLEIDLSHGVLSDMHGRNITIPKGKVMISGMMAEDQDGDIELLMDGNLASYLYILNHRRLHLLSRLPLKLGNPRGHLKTQLGIKLPLDSRVTMAQIDFDIHALYQGLSVDTNWIGAVRNCTGSLDFDGVTLKMAGSAVLHDVPMSISLEDRLSFPMERHAQIQAWVNDEELRKLGVSVPKNLFTGSARLEADLQQKEARNRKISGDIHLLLDLNKIGLKTAFWSKRTDQNAYLKIHANLKGNHLDKIDEITAAGPDLSLNGTALMMGDEMNGLEITSYQLGRNKGNMRFKWPLKEGDSQPYYANITASFLDITPIFSKSEKKNQKNEAKKTVINLKTPHQSKNLWLPKGRWDLHLSAVKTLYEEHKSLSDLQISASWQDRKVDNVAASFKKPTSVVFEIKKKANQGNEHSFKFSIENIAILCNEMFDYHQLDGGSLHFDGDFSSQKQEQSMGWGLGLAPFHGALKIEKLNLLHPPSVLTAATLFAPLHWGEIRRDRFENIALSSDISVKDKKMNLSDGQIGNAILGGTFTGYVDMRQRDMALTGTVSPFFRINAAPGHIPKIGSYFAPEKGSGMVAATYSVKGSLDDPKIGVNPFALFLPGILREMLH